MPNNFPVLPALPNTAVYNFGVSGNGVVTDFLTGAGAVSIFTAGTNGAYLKAIISCAVGTNDAGKIVLFYDDLTRVRQIAEVPVESSVFSSTERNAPAMELFDRSITLRGGFGMKAGHHILIGTTTALATGYTAFPLGGDY